ncbi:hypothetical protein [Streptomyces sp. NPDC055509]
MRRLLVAQNKSKVKGLGKSTANPLEYISPPARNQPVLRHSRFDRREPSVASWKSSVRVPT